VIKREKEYRLLDVLQNLDFYQRLPMKPLLVSNDLDGHLLSCLVIHRLYNLAK